MIPFASVGVVRRRAARGLAVRPGSTLGNGGGAPAGWLRQSVAAAVDAIRHLDPTGSSSRARRQALAALLEDVARSLRAGAGLAEALDAAVATIPEPLAQQVRSLLARHAAGEEWTQALAWWGDQAADPCVTPVASVLALAGQLGGPRARVVDQAAASLRDRLVAEDELRAQVSQVWASATVLVVAPLAFALLSALVDPRVPSFLFTTPVGAACLVVGTGLDLVGAWWMHRMVRRVLR